MCKDDVGERAENSFNDPIEAWEEEDMSGGNAGENGSLMDEYNTTTDVRDDMSMHEVIENLQFHYDEYQCCHGLHWVCKDN